MSLHSFEQVSTFFNTDKKHDFARQLTPGGALESNMTTTAEPKKKKRK